MIEKILRHFGFETRHVSIYSKEESDWAIVSILTPGVSSHAVTEVLTKKGRLLVDSNAPWISVDTDRQPIPVDTIQSISEDKRSINWPKKPPSKLYLNPFTFVYGLYSRHGKFYPPYNFIPDINYREFIQNFF